RREHGISGKAGDPVAVEPERQWLAAVERDAAERVRRVSGKTIGLTHAMAPAGETKSAIAVRSFAGSCAANQRFSSGSGVPASSRASENAKNGAASSKPATRNCLPTLPITGAPSRVAKRR